MLGLAQVGKRLAIGGVGTHHQRRRGRTAASGRARGQGCGEGRPARRGGQRQFQQVFFLVVQFADRRQHSGRGKGRAGSGGRVNEHHAVAGTPGLPCDAEAHDSAADNGNRW